MRISLLPHHRDAKRRPEATLWLLIPKFSCFPKRPACRRSQDLLYPNFRPLVRRFLNASCWLAVQAFGRPERACSPAVPFGAAGGLPSHPIPAWPCSTSSGAVSGRVKAVPIQKIRQRSSCGKNQSLVSDRPIWPKSSIEYVKIGEKSQVGESVVFVHLWPLEGLALERGIPRPEMVIFRAKTRFADTGRSRRRKYVPIDSTSLWLCSGA